MLARHSATQEREAIARLEDFKTPAFSIEMRASQR